MSYVKNFKDFINEEDSVKSEEPKTVMVNQPFGLLRKKDSLQLKLKKQKILMYFNYLLQENFFLILLIFLQFQLIFYDC